MGFDHRERCFTPRSTEVPRAIRSKNRTGPLEAKTVRSSKTVCPQTGARQKRTKIVGSSEDPPSNKLWCLKVGVLKCLGLFGDVSC